MIARRRKVLAAHNLRFKNNGPNPVSMQDLAVLWRPFLFLMNVFGLVDCYGRTSSLLRRSMWGAYAFISTVFLVIMAFYYLNACKLYSVQFDNKFVTCIENAFWRLTATNAKINFFVANYYAPCLPHFFLWWEKVKFPLKYTLVLQKSVRRIMWTMLAITVSYILIHLAGKNHFCIPRSRKHICAFKILTIDNLD